MFYITVKQAPKYHQMTLEEFLFGGDNIPCLISANTTNTRTYEVHRVSDRFKSKVDIDNIIELLKKFNEETEHLRTLDRQSLYSTFYVPKRSGGLRRIDAPNQELMEALQDLKKILENNCGVLYHTSAFAYIKKRSTISAVKKHQQNESKWFGKYDLSNFFGNTTLDFVMKQFRMIFPFCEICKTETGKNELLKALELAFLNGGLPQGTPISPLITNAMMIPIDYKLCNKLRDLQTSEQYTQAFIYTRYADDFLISSKYGFDFKMIENVIKETLDEFEAPFKINSKKTRYGSSSGSNWNLGVMLNKDNEITIGYKKKRQFQAMLSSYAADKLNGVSWERYDIQVLDGLKAYYRMVERESIDSLVKKIGDKFGICIPNEIKKDLKEIQY